jgi:ElaB/YqjD/DUF883 family membrane-anchored ribosome-binding protein
MAEKSQLTHGDDVARIRADIEQTRANMGDTLNAIQERLSPERLKAQAKESIREATIGRVEKMARKVGDRASDTGRGLLDVARDNPVPLALIGIGAGWLLYNSKRRSTSRGDAERDAIGYESAYTGEGSYTRAHEPGITQRARESASHAVDSVSERVSQVGESMRTKTSDAVHHLSEVASGVSERVGEVAGSVSRGAHRAEERASSAAMRARYQYEETPWVGAAVAIALGAAAGMSIPSSRREQELLGDRRDELLGRAREIGREKLAAVRRVAEGVVEETKEAMREHAAEEGLAGSGPSARENERGYGL